jgi:hypothetical protein
VFRIWTAELLAILLALGAPWPLFARSTAQEKRPTIQEQLVVMPAGSVVEVKTLGKQKLRGRLGAMTADSFELQTAKGEKVQTQSLRFDEVKSVKAVTSKGMAVGAKIGWGILIFAVVIGVVAAIACGTHGCSG